MTLVDGSGPVARDGVDSLRSNSGRVFAAAAVLLIAVAALLAGRRARRRS